MDITYHYPPDLLSLMVDAIPRLCRGKLDVLTFFAGAGVANTMTRDLYARVIADKRNISKYEIARTVLVRINETGEATLRERREVLKRVIEFEDFSSCWENDRLEAQGLVARVRAVVGAKDTFTRMKQEYEAEREKRAREYEERTAKIARTREERETARGELAGVFGEQNPQRRGKRLEAALNRIFKLDGILVREAFTIRGDEGDGIVEQIDGLITLDGHLYLVEMKWHAQPLGVGEVSRHLVRVHGRDGARGLLISSSGFTTPAVAECKKHLTKLTFVLAELEELVRVLNDERDLREWLRTKVEAAVADQQPLKR